MKHLLLTVIVGLIPSQSSLITAPMTNLLLRLRSFSLGFDCRLSYRITQYLLRHLWRQIVFLHELTSCALLRLRFRCLDLTSNLSHPSTDNLIKTPFQAMIFEILLAM